jgi:Hemolysins and related proteins containing CBS domains
MCPRVDVFALESNKKNGEIIDILLSKGLWRVPVYEENLDTLNGVLYARDVIRHPVKTD